MPSETNKFARKVGGALLALPRLALVFGAAGIAAIAAAPALTPKDRDPQPPRGASPAMPVATNALQLRPVVAAQAQQINAAIPVAKGDNHPAQAFSTGSTSGFDREQALECMTSAIYYEAASESSDGQRAVAQVVLNRVRHPAFPNTVCGVVYQGSPARTGCQFTFTCDGSLNRRPSRSEWLRARKIAEAALGGEAFAPVGLATHYHANFVVPYWAHSLTKNAVIGAHIFYRWPGGWGQPRAFTSKYRGSEPNAAALFRTAVAHHLNGPPGPSGRPSLVDPAADQRFASLAVQVEVAERNLGANHPEMKNIKKQRAELARKSLASSGTSLAAVETELARASRTLGARHPRIIALEELRDKLRQRHADS